jgi:Protein of unknown function (DUF3467)
VRPVDLFEQNHPRELMRERDRAQRQAMADVLELQPEWPADHEAKVLSALAPRLEEAAEADRVDLLPLPIEQGDEHPLGDAAGDVVVLAHLDQLELDMTGEQLLVMLDIVGERRAQPPDGNDEDPHDARYYVSMEDPGRPERHINIHFSPDIMAGVYANFANVSHSDYEFTITFARVDHEVEDDEIPGVVVSRINLSARFMRELIDAMQDNYSKWQTREGIKNLPEYGGRQETDDDSE